MIKSFKSMKNLLLSDSILGNSRNPVLLVQHGMIASIKDAELFRNMVDRNICVVSIARPGYGDSSCYELKDISEYGDIAAELLDYLGISDFSVLGTSSGAPYALSVSHRLPERTKSAFIFSGTPLLTNPHVAALWPYPLEQGKSVAHFQKVASEIFGWMSDPSRAGRNDVIDSRKNDFYGPTLDLKISAEDWGFSLAEIHGKVLYEHSLDDEQVPFRTASLTASLIPGSEFIKRDGGGHFSEDTLSRFLREYVVPRISGEKTAGGH